MYVLMPNMQIIISVPFYMYHILSLLPRDILQKGCKAILRIHQGNLLHSWQANWLRVHWGNARETSLWCTNLIYMQFFSTPSSQQFGIKLAAQEYGIFVNQNRFATCGNCMMTSSNGNISALLAICEGISLATGKFPAQRLVTWNFDSFLFAPEKKNRLR